MLRARALFTSLASLSLLAGCLDGGTDKGDEDDVPTDGKADNGSSGVCAAEFASCVLGGGGGACATNWCSGSCVSEVAACVRGGGGVACSGRCIGSPTCEAPAPMPAYTAYTAACGGKLAAVFETGKVVSSRYKVSMLFDRCNGLSSLERKAMDYYAEYLAENYDAAVEDLAFNIETKVLAGTSAAGGGTIMVVDDGSGESATRFVFDKSGKLLSFFHDHFNRPGVAFFCGAAGQAEIVLPNAGACLNGLTSVVVHLASAERTFNLTAAPGNLPSGTTAAIATAFRHYRAANGTAASTQLTAAGKTWKDAYESAGIFNLTAPGKPATRYVVERELLLLEAPTGKPAALVCR